jgi:plastocyanin
MRSQKKNITAILLFLGVCTSLVYLYPQEKYVLSLFTSKMTDTASKAFGTLTNPATSTHRIVLTETGFSPTNSIIYVGDTVIFSTNTNRPFWPASSLHPTHEIYPEFDAKTPIAPQNSYQFTFTQPGSWAYHDHIASHYTGTIDVLETGETRIDKTKILTDDCMRLGGSQKTQCWDQQLKETVRIKGTDAGFEYLIAVYNAEPDVAKTCHEWVHVLGEAGYEVFAKGEDFKLRPETAWCSYGYFHGFMNAMIIDTGNLEQVVDFCNMAVTQLKEGQPENELPRGKPSPYSAIAP